MNGIEDFISPSLWLPLSPYGVLSSHLDICKGKKKTLAGWSGEVQAGKRLITPPILSFLIIPLEEGSPNILAGSTQIDLRAT